MAKNENPADKRSPGRPPHVPTAILRRRVSIAAGSGMRHEDIAIAIGIDRHTLVKYYESDLSEGALARRMEVVNAMHAAAKRGSSSAARVYLEHEARVSAPPVPAGAQPAEAVPQKPVPVGKKEQANVDAVGAQRGTEWEDILPSHTHLQ